MLKISGPQELAGDVYISGSKNAALPLIASALFHTHSRLENVPAIGDVHTYIDILRSLHIDVTYVDNILTIDTTHISLEGMNTGLIAKIRASILLFPALLQRFGSISLPFPGGCVIGKRPVEDHIRGLQAFGYVYTATEDTMEFSGETMSADVHISAGFSVTATENILLIAAYRAGHTTIDQCAIEPHVMNLIDVLRTNGADIVVNYDHSICIKGTNIKDKDAYRANIEPQLYVGKVISDYIESGTFVVLAALCSRDYIDIHDARIGDLGVYIAKCRDMGVRIEDMGSDILRVYRSRTLLKPVHIQTNIYPGFPTDLQSPFALLMTQADGVSRIHEILFEGRLNWLVEIEKMKGHIAILNPHEAMIWGPTRLRGATVSSWDLRAGVTMILAGMIARGDTYITNVEYIQRGYEDIVGKIQKLGGKVEEV